jgi:hypothetical protein
VSMGVGVGRAATHAAAEENSLLSKLKSLREGFFSGRALRRRGTAHSRERTGTCPVGTNRPGDRREHDLA